MIGIVGGGLAGLVAAYDLTQAGQRVVILESASRLGGQVWTESSDGFLIDHGAEGYAAGRQSASGLVADLGLTGRLVSQITKSSMILKGGRLTSVSVSEAARLAGIQADGTDFGRGIASFRAGTGELIAALVAALAGSGAIRLGEAAVRLTPGAGAWRITTGQGDTVDAEAVVLAVPAAAAARLVAAVSGRAARMLKSFQTVSSVSVALACPASAVNLPPDAGGFIPSGGSTQEGFRACDIPSAKFPGRAPSGSVLLRAFFRPGPAYPLDAPDSRWVQWAVEAIWPALEIGAQPAHAWVARWPQALPRYGAEHAESLSAVTHLLAGGPPLELAGAAYRASGMAGAIESARAAARSLARVTT